MLPLSVCRNKTEMFEFVYINKKNSSERVNRDENSKSNMETKHWVCLCTFITGLCLHVWQMEKEINSTNACCEILPAIFQQCGVNSGLLVQQLSCISLPPVLPLRFVHFLENTAHRRVHSAPKKIQYKTKDTKNKENC